MTPAPVYVDPSEASRWEWAILEIKGKRPRTLAGRVRRDFELGVPMLRVEIPHGDLWRVHYFDAKAIFHIALTCEADVREQAARLDARVAPGIGGRRYRHVRRGSTYRVIGAASVQAATPIGEGDAVIVYQGESDGRLWARPVGEFEDGRFVEIEAEPDGAIAPVRTREPLDHHDG